MADRPWLDDLVRDAVRFRIVYLQLGSAFDPLREDLGGLDCAQIEAVTYAQSASTVDSDESADRDESPAPRQLLIINGVEDLRNRRSPSLGELRAQVLRDVDAGISVVLVSRISKESFPPSVGSDLLSDARQHFLSVDLPEADSLSCLPGRVPELEDSLFLERCLEEVGNGTLESLGRLIWEYMKSPNDALEALDAATLMSLRGAGLVVLQNGKACWTPISCWKEFRLAVARASSTGSRPEDGLGQIFVDIWVLERVIRNQIRAGLIGKLGSGWRTTCIPSGMRKEVLERARKDAQPRADKIADLRDPLEWLTTAELLDLRLTHELGELGLESYLWTKLREVILPIRNRIAHMRLVDQKDALDVRTWRAVAEKRFDVVGHR